MGDTSLRGALETVYATVTVGYMVIGKAYSHTICGHRLSTSTLLSLIMHEFWDDLSPEE